MMEKLKPLILAIWLVLIMAGCGISDDSDESSYRQVSTDEAVAIMEEESDYIILDVRTSEEFREQHIPDETRTKASEQMKSKNFRIQNS